ncbi:Retrovirus-related Pol polyprotein from transposon TNT 1-94 [Quillaja saponaria]|uniref:Retrovirus-related Pol polyprotein from transposon TNT 1-94 n=1 Tax=Quillaja saponaria TaxID=32244 RepID=A0AAD7LPX8_QUISA|nr:Retrovirus-related Pol polyprotein from transposon TNT 1-94 [Quillaja saponaria]
MDKSVHSEVALVTTHHRSATQKSGSQSCKNCNHTGHSFANCPTVVCIYYHGIGHILENCPTHPPRPKSGSFKPKNVSKTGSSSIAAATTKVSTVIMISDLEALFKQVQDLQTGADSGDLNDNPSTSESTPTKPAAAAGLAPAFNTTIQRSTRQAMNGELQALEKTHTWDLVDLLSGKTPIGCKWVYKIKTRSDSSIERYKAYLVAKGYNQEYRIDYEETFAPVAWLTSVRSLLAITAVQKWKLLQMDVKNAFMNGDLQEKVLAFPILLTKFVDSVKHYMA